MLAGHSTSTVAEGELAGIRNGPTDRRSSCRTALGVTTVAAGAVALYSAASAEAGALYVHETDDLSVHSIWCR